MFKFVTIVSAVALLCACQTATAQAGPAPLQTQEEEQRDCILIGVGWQGTAQERANVLAEPIPPSYIRQLNNRAPCAFSAPPEYLVQWHLQFGTEQSTFEALRFIADRQHRPSPDGDIYHARIWVMAADFWQSERLLDAAQRYVWAAQRWMTSAQRLEEGGELAPDSTYDADDVKRRAPDIIQRTAVLRAEMTGERGDYESAVALVQQYTPADYITAAELAYGSGDDFCDWGTERLNAEQLVPFSERCDELEAAGSNMWDIHARLNLSPFAPTSLQGNPFDFATERAASFLTRQGRNDEIAPGSQWHHDEIYRLVALYIHTADARFRRDRRPRYVGNAVNQAQFLLQKAFPWVSPASHPNLFRRVAARYLELDALARAERPDDVRPNDQEDRFIIWLREEVALLDRLYGPREFGPAYSR